MNLMTLQQQAAAAIDKLPEDKLYAIIQFADFLRGNSQISIDRTSPAFFNVIATDKEENILTTHNKKKNKIKFGMGKGIITNVDMFDDYNDEIYNTFLEEES